jgi:hypothetical protein
LRVNVQRLVGRREIWVCERLATLEVSESILTVLLKGVLNVFIKLFPKYPLYTRTLCIIMFFDTQHLHSCHMTFPIFILPITAYTCTCIYTRLQLYVHVGNLWKCTVHWTQHSYHETLLTHDLSYIGLLYIHCTYFTLNSCIYYTSREYYFTLYPTHVIV